MSTVRRLLVGWSETTQLQARRNALIASTDLAARRAEREDVAAFLAAHARPSLPSLEARPVAHTG